MNMKDIFTFEPLPKPVLTDEAFVFGVVGIAHPHIFEMCEQLIAAGAVLKYVFDDDKALVESFKIRYPLAEICRSYDELLDKADIKLVVSAAVPSERAAIGIRAMLAGKDYFCDKAPMTDIRQLEEVKKTCKATKRKYFVFYSERIGNEASVFAGQLIKRGVIGEVFHIDSFAPHRLNPSSRPDWFFKKKSTGGILIDIGSHQTEQILYYAENDNPRLRDANVYNYFNKNYTEFEDYGDMSFVFDNGVTAFVRVDWNSPAGIKTFGDVRLFIEGSNGTIELRKNCEIGHENQSNMVYVANNDGVFYESVTGKVGFPYFSRLINDCIYRTETAMNQDHTFAAAELAIKAQCMAESKKQN